MEAALGQKWGKDKEPMNMVCTGPSPAPPQTKCPQFLSPKGK